MQAVADWLHNHSQCVTLEPTGARPKRRRPQQTMPKRKSTRLEGSGTVCAVATAAPNNPLRISR